MNSQLNWKVVEYKGEHVSLGLNFRKCLLSLTILSSFPVVFHELADDSALTY